MNWTKALSYVFCELGLTLLNYFCPESTSQDFDELSRPFPSNPTDTILSEFVTADNAVKVLFIIQQDRDFLERERELSLPIRDFLSDDDQNKLDLLSRS